MAWPPPTDATTTAAPAIIGPAPAGVAVTVVVVVAILGPVGVVVLRPRCSRGSGAGPRRPSATRRPPGGRSPVASACHVPRLVTALWAARRLSGKVPYATSRGTASMPLSRDWSDVVVSSLANFTGPIAVKGEADRYARATSTTTSFATCAEQKAGCFQRRYTGTAAARHRARLSARLTANGSVPPLGRCKSSSRPIGQPVPANRHGVTGDARRRTAWPGALRSAIGPWRPRGGRRGNLFIGCSAGLASRSRLRPGWSPCRAQGYSRPWYCTPSTKMSHEREWQAAAGESADGTVRGVDVLCRSPLRLGAIALPAGGDGRAGDERRLKSMPGGMRRTPRARR